MPRRLLPLLLILGLASPLAAQSAPPDGEATPAAAATPALPQAWADAIDWRSIGPANMSGRITALSIVESDPSIWYVATASGGLLKTTNNGVTFTHHFDDQATVSIGDVCAAPSDPQIVYIGTG
ncbi:MAG: WD40/YVTN/BNR-like repeat-containing protein, partial [Planctomycetota bacterium]